MNTDLNQGGRYHGTFVRKLFLAGAIIMLLTLPSLNPLLPVPAFVSVMAILVIGFIAGLTNPKQTSVTALNTIVAAIAFVVFEYYAIDSIRLMQATPELFWINQLLAINFFVAMYYSSKTLRGMLLNK